MLMCYVDESGDTGLFDANERNSQPVFLLCALMVNQSRLESITREVIHLKQSHFPSYSQGIQHWHDWLKVEVKGANIRRALREDTRKSRRHILGFLSAIVTLLESNDARISARVYIKEPACEFKGASVYSAAMQRLAQTFEDKLIRENENHARERKRSDCPRQPQQGEERPRGAQPLHVELQHTRHGIPLHG